MIKVVRISWINITIVKIIRNQIYNRLRTTTRMKPTFMKKITWENLLVSRILMITLTVFTITHLSCLSNDDKLVKRDDDRERERNKTYIVYIYNTRRQMKREFFFISTPNYLCIWNTHIYSSYIYITSINLTLHEIYIHNFNQQQQKFIPFSLSLYRTYKYNSNRNDLRVFFLGCYLSLLEVNSRTDLDIC